MKNQYIHNLSFVLLLTLTLGGFGSALYLFLEKIHNVNEKSTKSLTSQKPLVKKVTLSSKKTTENLKPSIALKPSARKERSARKEPLAKKEPSSEFISSAGLEPSARTEHLVINKPTVTEKETSTELDNEYSPFLDEEPLALLNKELAELDQKPVTSFYSDQSDIFAPKRFEKPVVRKKLITQDDLAYQAELRLQSKVTYDGRYVKIGYPMGDVPQHIGVCTDVVIRSLRGLGIDLQQRVHEDMKQAFRSYPNNWQLSRPDTNIDHRRVPNLMTYFKRAGAKLNITNNPSDYKAGNIVAWDLGGGFTHIGIVSNYVSENSNNPLIVHNIGAGPELNDILFKHRIIGHYNYGKNFGVNQNWVKSPKQDEVNLESYVLN